MLQNVVVAGNFAFQTKLLGNPPDGGVEKKEGLQDLLEQVGPIITAADVGQFMPQHRFGFPGWLTRGQ